MSNHTPGDWEMVVAPKFGPEEYEGITIESPDHNTIICEIAGGLPLIEILGNAQLITKAPKMLEVIHQLLNCTDLNTDELDETSLEAIETAGYLIQKIEKVEAL